MIISVAAVPEDVKVRNVTVSVSDKDGVVLSTHVETPESTYCWKVAIGKDTFWVNGDYAICCIAGKEVEDDKIVGTYTKVHPKTGEVKYGPAEVRQSQLDAWKAAGAVK